MTVTEFDYEGKVRPCQRCGEVPLATQRNPNNNGLQVVCPHCGCKTPWGSLLYLKQNERNRQRRPPLPNGETLDSIWEKYDNRCVVCSAPKDALVTFGIGRQVHHVVPYAAEGHRGPVVPICTHCHSVATERQRVYWFFQRVTLKALGRGDDADRSEGLDSDANVVSDLMGHR